MLSDQARIGAYRRDIVTSVPGKRVLEVGPGPRAVLSRMCLNAGAASVVSVEGDPWVAERAERCLRRERRHAGRWRIVPTMSNDITVDDVDGDPHFDVLVLEVYDTIVGGRGKYGGEGKGSCSPGRHSGCVSGGRRACAACEGATRCQRSVKLRRGRTVTDDLRKRLERPLQGALQLQKSSATDGHILREIIHAVEWPDRV